MTLSSQLAAIKADLKEYCQPNSCVIPGNLLYHAHNLFTAVEVLAEALDKINKNKVGSIDKVVLLLNLEAHQDMSREALQKATEILK